MPRPKRLEFPGAMCHVIVRGNEPKAVFRGDADREFLPAAGGALQGDVLEEIEIVEHRIHARR